ncbi:MAG: HAMP domain-containing histidine kinase, partial [Alistipes sp.]|nr:HAMP domain-containing histidine kinase [Alistipes sp.]
MQIVSDETKRLSRLVRSMLDIAQLQSEGGIPEEKKTRFDISECAGQMLLTFEQKILGKQLDVDVQFPDYHRTPTYFGVASWLLCRLDAPPRQEQGASSGQ